METNVEATQDGAVIEATEQTQADTQSEMQAAVQEEQAVTQEQESEEQTSE